MYPFALAERHERVQALLLLLLLEVRHDDADDVDRAEMEMIDWSNDKAGTGYAVDADTEVGRDIAKENEIIQSMRSLLIGD